MAFTLEQFAKSRPYSYHNTSLTNLASIRAERQLYSAATLLEMSRRSDLLRVRRTSAESVRVGIKQYFLQTQRPLHEGNVEFLGGWSLADLVESINHRVFFWPGNVNGQITSGQLHSKSGTGPFETVVLRIPTAHLIQENGQSTPYFSCYNSGSPRCNKRKKSPRGPETFLAAESFSRGWGSVVELTFSGSVRLPDSAECLCGSEGHWKQL